MSYMAAIVNPRQARPPVGHPNACAAVAIATMFYFEKAKQNRWVTTIYVFQSYLCLQTDIYNQTLHVCPMVCSTPIPAFGSITLVKLSHYKPHYQNGVCTYHGAVCLCAHMATTRAFDFIQCNIKMLFKYVVKISRKYSIRISSTPLHCKPV